MRDFKDIKIVASFPAHDDDKWIDKVLDNLSLYTNEIYINLNDATPYIKKVVKNHPKVIKWIETTNNGNRWSQGKVRDDTIRMLDDIQPDIVLAPDSDETYPNNLMEMLKEFWEDEQKRTFWFRLYYMHEDEDHIRNDGIWKTIHHVRAFKWEPGLTFIKYAGYACPTEYINLPRVTKYHSKVPNFHWGYMLTDDRQRKFIRAGEKHNYHNEEYRNVVDKNMIIHEITPEIKKLID